jgi:hypothetical protein
MDEEITKRVWFLRLCFTLYYLKNSFIFIISFNWILIIS